MQKWFWLPLQIDYEKMAKQLSETLESRGEWNTRNDTRLGRSDCRVWDSKILNPTLKVFERLNTSRILSFCRENTTEKSYKSFYCASCATQVEV